MSVHTLETFLGSAARDKTLAAEIAAALDGKSGMAASDSIAQLASGKGYALSTTQVEAGRLRMLDALQESKDLSDEDLETVSGGVDPVTIGIIGVSTVLAVGTIGGAVAAGLGIGAGLNAAQDHIKNFLKGW